IRDAQGSAAGQRRADRDRARLGASAAADPDRPRRPPSVDLAGAADPLRISGDAIAVRRDRALRRNREHVGPRTGVQRRVEPRRSGRGLRPLSPAPAGLLLSGQPARQLLDGVGFFNLTLPTLVTLPPFDLAFRLIT